MACSKCTPVQKRGHQPLCPTRCRGTRPAQGVCNAGMNELSSDPVCAGRVGSTEAAAGWGTVCQSVCRLLARACVREAEC